MHYRPDPSGSHYLVEKPVATTFGGGEVLEIRFDHQIGKQEWRRALDFNLDCLTRSHECLQIGDYQPSAWADYLKGDPR
jgi:hypothetical protein